MNPVFEQMLSSIQKKLRGIAIPSDDAGTFTRDVYLSGEETNVSAPKIIVGDTELQSLKCGENTVSAQSLVDNISLGSLPLVVSCLVNVKWVDEYGTELYRYSGICAKDLHYHIEPDLEPNKWDLNASAFDQVVEGAVTKTIKAVYNHKPVNLRFWYRGDLVMTVVQKLYLGQKYFLTDRYETQGDASTSFIQVAHRMLSIVITQDHIDNGIDIDCYEKREVEFYDVYDWTQPVLTGRTTSTDLGEIVCSASSEFVDDRVDPQGNREEGPEEYNYCWHAMDGVRSGYLPSTFWGPGTHKDLANADNDVPQNFGAWWQVKFPYKLWITGITVYNRYSGASPATSDQTKIEGVFYTSSDKSEMIGSYMTGSNQGAWWQTPVPNIRTEGVVTDTLYFFKHDNSSDWAGLGEVVITARRLKPAIQANHSFVFVKKQYCLFAYICM